MKAATNIPFQIDHFGQYYCENISWQVTTEFLTSRSTLKSVRLNVEAEFDMPMVLWDRFLQANQLLHSIHVINNHSAARPMRTPIALSVAAYCTGIKQLTLHFGGAFTEGYVIAIAQHCQLLTDLSLCQCTAISSKCSLVIAQHCLRMKAL